MGIKRKIKTHRFSWTHLMFFVVIVTTFLDCKKDKTVNQFGEWDITITRTRTYKDSVSTVVESTEKNTLILNEDYSGLFKENEIRWYLTKSKIVIFKCAEHNLDDFIEYDIIIDEKDHQQWNVDINDYYFIQHENWNLYEK